MKVVCVKVCGVIEAEAGKALLEANGIRAEIAPFSEAAVSAVAGGTGSMGILVRDTDYQAALELLGAGEHEAVAQRRVQQGAQSPQTHPLSPVEQEEKAQQGLRRMARGLVQVALGAALTVGSDWIASQGLSGVALIFYGLIIVGLIDFGAGLSSWLKNRG